MSLLEKIMPKDKNQRTVASIGITVIISGLLTVWGIYGIGEYGVAMFIFTPILIGALPTMLYGYKHQVTYNEAWKISFLTLLIYTLCLLVLAIEGLICIAMSLPIVILLAWLGSFIGFTIIKNTKDNAPKSMLILIGIIPVIAFIEKDKEPMLTSVVSSVEINADLQSVWKNVIEFPQLDEPKEFLFKTGIAYPVDAKIDGEGVGAVRHCNFTTGSFVEPITIWDEPHLLKFDVVEQPEPMKELSFWDIDAPHLHDYFVSKKGQFKLTELPNGKTLLEGTTWYYHNIRPTFYWQLWSDYIIHKIHERILTHIKKNAEKTKIATNAKNTSPKPEKIKEEVMPHKDTIPLYGKLSQEQIDLYFPGILDTVKERVAVGSRKVDLKNQKKLFATILYNTGTFEQMFLCTHDKNFNLLDTYYIGISTMFDMSSHSINYNKINDNELEFHHVNWGYVERNDVSEIDTLNYNRYVLTITDNGRIVKNNR